MVCMSARSQRTATRPGFVRRLNKLRTIEMKVKLNALLLTTMVAFISAAHPSNPPASPRPNPAMPPALMRPPGPKEPAPQMPDKDTLSYFIGMSVGTRIKKQDLTVVG